MDSDPPVQPAPKLESQRAPILGSYQARILIRDGAGAEAPTLEQLNRTIAAAIQGDYGLTASVRSERMDRD